MRTDSQNQKFTLGQWNKWADQWLPKLQFAVTGGVSGDIVTQEGSNDQVAN